MFDVEKYFEIFLSNLGNSIAFLALIVSVVVGCKQNKFSKAQHITNEKQRQLTERLLEKEQAEIAKEKTADVSARGISLGSSKRLKIWNNGPATAKNVRVEFPNGCDEVFSPSEIEGKFPLVLFRQASVEIHASLSICSPDKYLIQLMWDDDEGVNKSKNVDITF